MYFSSVQPLHQGHPLQNVPSQELSKLELEVVVEDKKVVSC